MNDNKEAKPKTEEELSKELDLLFERLKAAMDRLRLHIENKELH